MVEKWWNDGGAMSNNMKFFPQKQFVFVVFDSTPKPVVFGYFWASRCSANTDRTAASKDMPTSRQHRRLVSTCPLVVIFLAKTHRVGDWCICKQRSFPAFPAAASGSLKRVFGGSFQSSDGWRSLTFLCTWKNKKNTNFLMLLWGLHMQNYHYNMTLFTRFARWIREALRETSAALLRPRYAGRYSQTTTRAETPWTRQKHTSVVWLKACLVSGLKGVSYHANHNIPVLLQTGKMRLVCLATTYILTHNQAEKNLVSELRMISH